MLLQTYDRVRIVSLRSRTDRRRQMRRQIRTMGPIEGERLRFVDAYSISEPGPFRKIGSHGCFLTYLQILRQAAAENESVLILQDDCNFLPHARHHFVLPCDVFYGSHSSDADTIIGAHCMGFSAKAAQKAATYLAAFYCSPAFKPDSYAASEPGFDPLIRPPIDGAIVWFRRAHPELTTRFAMLAYQRSSRSDVTPGLLDRLPLVREAAGFARAALITRQRPPAERAEAEPGRLRSASMTPDASQY